MLEMAKASLHVKRQLTKRELCTIAVALEVLSRSKANAALQDARLAVALDEALLADQEIRALAHELTTARKVKLCRSKRPAV